jgi:hypothetical protein
MATVTLPSLSTSKPIASDFDAAFDALLTAIGGHLGATRYAGGLDTNNLKSTNTGFRNRQKKEARAFFTLTGQHGTGSTTESIPEVATMGILPFPSLLHAVAIHSTANTANMPMQNGDVLEIGAEEAKVITVTYPPAEPLVAPPYGAAVWSLPAPIIVAAGKMIWSDFRSSSGTHDPATGRLKTVLLFSALHVTPAV